MHGCTMPSSVLAYTGYRSTRESMVICALNAHCTILLNHKAGALHPTATREQVEEMVAHLQLDAAVVSTASAEEMKSLIRQLVVTRTEIVAVAGGDGTVALAVQEMAGTDTVLGIIPQGTFNNFATALHLPQDLPSALRVLKDGPVREVDLGKIGDTYFTEAAGVGLFANALALYGKGTNKNLWRGLRAMARIILSLQSHRIWLTIDGKTTMERAVMCTISNTFRMGAGVPVAPGARLTDGLLDVVIVGDLKRSELLSYYRAFRAQVHTRLPKVTTLRATKMHITSRHHMNVHADDRVVATTPVMVSVQPHALRVLVDRL